MFLFNVNELKKLAHVVNAGSQCESMTDFNVSMTSVSIWCDHLFKS